MLLAFILVPLAVLIVLNLPWPRIMRPVAFWIAASLYQAEIFLGWGSLARQTVLSTGLGQFLPYVSLSIDPLSALMLVIIGLGFLVSLLTGRTHFLSQSGRSWFNFINLQLICFAALNGAVLTTDLFSLYVFIEASVVAGAVMVAFHKDKDGLEGALKFIVLMVLTSMLMLVSIALIIMLSGGTDFQSAAVALKTHSSHPLAIVAMALFLAGVFIKSGLAPFHGWVPDTYGSAPAPVTLLFAGVITKASGVYVMIRLGRDVFGLDGSVGSVLLVVGALSVLVGAVAAIGQNDLKRLLSYSSISQMGYVAMGLACGTPLGIAGAVLHMLNHAIFSPLLFLNVEAVESRLGTRDLSRIGGGLGGRMPVTAATSILGALSTAGVPPLSGFWSKLMIIMALWNSGRPMWAAYGVVLSVVTLAYMLRFQRRVFFGKPAEDVSGVREADASLVSPAVLLAILTVGMGLVFPMLAQLICPWKG